MEVKRHVLTLQSALNDLTLQSAPTTHVERCFEQLEPRMSIFTRRLIVALGVLLPALAAEAQTITGVVRDESGAVMPGVTVEASSPALIEKTRRHDRQRRPVSHRQPEPGVYTVTFTLPGFNTVMREGIELTTDFTATVERRPQGRLARGNDHRLGRLADGRSCRSVTKQTVLTREVLDVLPTAHSIQAAGVLVPGVTTCRRLVGRRTRRRRQHASCSSRL